VWHRVLETIPFSDKTVLEIGCGLGHYAQALAPTTTSYTALDISETMLATARQRGAGTANLTFFPSLPEAERVLGFMFEEKARQYLRQHPSPQLGHRAIILRQRVTGA
jgi:SAM-dependent methyltransferase